MRNVHPVVRALSLAGRKLVKTRNAAVHLRAWGGTHICDPLLLLFAELLESPVLLVDMVGLRASEAPV
jgi:hypothetical protein